MGALSFFPLGKTGLGKFHWSLNHTPLPRKPLVPPRPERDSSSGPQGFLIRQKGQRQPASWGPHAAFRGSPAERHRPRAGLPTSKVPRQRPLPGLRRGTPEAGPRASTHFEPWVSNETGVVAEIGCVVLHHALCLRLAEVFVRRGKAAGGQHDGRTFWKRSKQSRSENAETSSQASRSLCHSVCLGGFKSFVRKAKTRHKQAWRRKQPSFSPFREFLVVSESKRQMYK